MLKAVLIILGVLLVFSFNYSINAEGLSELEKKATELILNNEYEKALIVIDTILEKNPENYDMLNNKGSIFLELEKFDEALEIFDEILDKNSNNSQALNNKGIALMNRGDIIDAYLVFYDALVVDPENKIAFENLEKLLFHIAWIDETNYGYAVLSIRDSNGVLTGYSLGDRIKIQPPLGYILLEQNAEKVTINGINYFKMTKTDVMKKSQYLGFYSANMPFAGQSIGVVVIEMNGLIVKQGDILSYELFIPERDFWNWKKSIQLK